MGRRVTGAAAHFGSPFAVPPGFRSCAPGLRWLPWGRSAPRRLQGIACGCAARAASFMATLPVIARPLRRSAARDGEAPTWTPRATYARPHSPTRMAGFHLPSPSPTKRQQLRLLREPADAHVGLRWGDFLDGTRSMT